MYLESLSWFVFILAIVEGWQTFEFEPIQEGRNIGGGVHKDANTATSAVSTCFVYDVVLAYLSYSHKMSL